MRTVRLRKKNIVLKKMVDIRTQEIESQKEELRAQASNLLEINSLLKDRQEEIETQRNELGALNATKDKFFSIIAHDLKNPFMGIIGISEILKNNFLKLEKDKAQGFIQGIYDSSKTAFNLLENLLTWSRSQTNSIEQKKETIIIKQVITQCFELLKLNFSEKKLKPIVKCDESIVAFADLQMITTIIRNLVNNAIKFTPKKGQITASAFYENDMVCIKIIDTGVGISEKVKDKLFRIDSQISTTGTSGEPGTGIGLIVVKEFIDKNNGTIEVNSEQGKGSEFIIYLPKSNDILENKINKESDKNEMQLETETDSLEKELEMIMSKFNFSETPIVLFVEDNPMIREKIQNDIQRKIKLFTAINGKKGLELAMEHIPDAILTDINMPEMNGLELCQALKSDVKTCHIPIIMLTSRDEAEHKLEGLETGADDYITKPFDTRELVLRLFNTLQTRFKLRENILKNISLESSNAPVTSLDEKFLAKAIAIVDANMENPDFEMSVMVENIGMSQAQLYRKLKALTGQTVSDFIKIIRIKRAAELLKEGKYSVSEAAYAVGFKNLSHFSKAFKEQFGVSPSKY